MIKVRKVWRSFGFAGQGIVDLFRYENNAKVHLLIAALVVVVGLCLQISRLEWAVILTLIGLVWAAEAFNTAIEKICDFVSPGLHPQIKAIKDLSSGAVLILAITAVLVGLIILGGKLLTML
ncbi:MULTISPECIES: diacylglycerol kinase family protein [Spirosoma]|uniref:Diacylglycerol kinase family protein n=1 Tax=Spirosoma liriopis TaxID=2937440 RepID=A0ABT0HFD6_9BACT|nr:MULTISPECIES: diacylglycerol kinase family protein [Spirosoma]MCK8490858.1 diacylglycerol kinase family protein [Spirosoma liriopis]UHG90243.1 diacylglycerol kinase family protein [Spirosoma oryzicola]